MLVDLVLPVSLLPRRDLSAYLVKIGIDSVDVHECLARKQDPDHWIGLHLLRGQPMKDADDTCTGMNEAADLEQHPRTLHRPGGQQHQRFGAVRFHIQDTRPKTSPTGIWSTSRNVSGPLARRCPAIWRAIQVSLDARERNTRTVTASTPVHDPTSAPNGPPPGRTGRVSDAGMTCHRRR